MVKERRLDPKLVHFVNEHHEIMRQNLAQGLVDHRHYLIWGLRREIEALKKGANAITGRLGRLAEAGATLSSLRASLGDGLRTDQMIMLREIEEDLRGEPHQT